MCNVRGVAHSDKPTKNYQNLQFPSTNCFGFLAREREIFFTFFQKKAALINRDAQ